MTQRFTVTYRIHSDAASIEARAQTIAVEQSVEMPLAAIDEPAVLNDIVGVVEAIEDLGSDLFEARIGLATATIGRDAGQLLNMLFGNTSLHDDVVLWDVALPPALISAFGGPRHGIAGLRDRLRVPERAFAGSALKPQGLPAERLAKLAESLTLGGLDFVKDDHGLANQDYSRFSDRLRACATAVRRGAQATGHPTRYIPSLTGDLDAMRAGARLAREEGLDCLLLAPMVSGFSSMTALVRDFPDMAFFAHPSLGGAARIAPDLLIGKLFPLIGADAIIFPNYGGRFGYSIDTCLRLAANARQPSLGLRSALPIPAGGMTIERTDEILDFYGPDTMLLIGGSLLLAREHIIPEAQRFARAVADHSPGKDRGHGQ